MPAPSSPTPDAPPLVAVRLVAQDGDTTRRVDVQLAGSVGLLVEDGATTTFETVELWPTVRDLLPAYDQLRADPQGARSTGPVERPGPGWAEACRAVVTIAVAAAPDGLATDDPDVVVRTWFATDAELWSATPQPDGSTDVRREPDGALADLLVWDVTGAMEALVRRVAS